MEKRYWPLLGIILAALVAPVPAQPMLEWEAIYQGPSWQDEGDRVLVDSLGNAYVSGTSAAAGVPPLQIGPRDLVVVKYSPDGQQLWEYRQTFDSLGVTSSRMRDMALTPDGFLVLAASGHMQDPQPRSVLLKLTPEGESQWASDVVAPNNRGTQVRDLAVDADGNVYLAGNVAGPQHPLQQRQAIVAKFDPQGQPLWATIYDPLGNWHDNMVWGLDIDGQGHAYLALGRMMPNWWGAGRIVKFDPSGQFIWAVDPQLPDGNPPVTIGDFQVDSAGTVLLAGSTQLQGLEQIYVMRLDSAGQRLWSAVHEDSDTRDHRGTSLRAAPDGTIYVAARSSQPGSGAEAFTGFLVVKFQEGGSEIWSARYDDPGFLLGMETDMELDQSGSAFLLGSSSTQQMPPLEYDLRLVQFNAAGEFMGAATYGGLIPGGNAIGRDLAVTPAGDAYVTGFGEDLADHPRMITLKYSPSTTGVEDPRFPGLPAAYDFQPFSPNPFNPQTVAKFEIRNASHVSLRVYDTAGREVAALVEGWRAAGTHEVSFDASGLPSGLYLARLEAGEFRATQKLVLLK